MRVLVTGASGFIGGWVVDELARQGHEAIRFDRRQRVISSKDPLEGDTFLGDMTNADDVTEAMAHAEGFIHLAAVLGTQETIGNPRPAAYGNVMGGLNVLEAAAQYRLPGVYIGVGNHWMQNTYSISKTTVERFVRMFNAERGTQVNVVRCVNAYGPGQVPAAPYGPSKVRKIMPAFICRALAGQPIEVYGDGRQISDCVYVGDVARVLVAAFDMAARGDVKPHAIEVGPVQHSTVNEIAQTVQTQVERQTGSTSPITHLAMRPGEEPGATVTADLSTLEGTGVDPKEFALLAWGVEATTEWLACLRAPSSEVDVVSLERSQS